MKLKKISSVFLAAALLAALFAPFASAAGVAAKATSSAVLVNGKTVAFEAYNISDNNYFKLRDLACALSGSEKQFEVGWDGAKNAISLTSGKAYTPVGGELTFSGVTAPEAQSSTSSVWLNGKQISLKAYAIGGYNYFKLRDLGAAVNFGVDWVRETNTVIIDTAKGYTADGKLTVRFLDVGQGDSEFVTLPNGKTMLIDAGEAEYGDRVVSDLRALGVTKIDYLVATHPHADHIGGLPKVIESFAVGVVFMPNATATTQTYKKLLTAIQSKGLKAGIVRAEAALFDEDGVTAAVVAPNSDSYDDLNNYSIVIRLSYKNNAFLFTGDAEALSEKEITANVQADVLKVGHHGSSSSTSAAFLKRVAPKYAVIEVGADNEYGHPAAAILKRLSSAGVAVYRTDQNGTVTMTSDGANISVTTER